MAEILAHLLITHDWTPPLAFAKCGHNFKGFVSVINRHSKSERGLPLIAHILYDHIDKNVLVSESTEYFCRHSRLVGQLFNANAGLVFYR